MIQYLVPLCQVLTTHSFIHFHSSLKCSQHWLITCHMPDNVLHMVKQKAINRNICFHDGCLLQDKEPVKKNCEEANECYRKVVEVGGGSWSWRDSGVPGEGRPRCKSDCTVRHRNLHSKTTPASPQPVFRTGVPSWTQFSTQQPEESCSSKHPIILLGKAFASVTLAPISLGIEPWLYR